MVKPAGRDAVTSEEMRVCGNRVFVESTGGGSVGAMVGGWLLVDWVG